MTMEAGQAQINGPARVVAAGQLVEAASFYRQALQTLLIFNMVAFFLCPILMLTVGKALGETAFDTFWTSAAWFFAALALTLLASFLAHLTLEERANAFFVEETVDERRARLAEGRAAPDDPRVVETEELSKQANAHASLASTSYLTSLFALFLALVAMGAAVFQAMAAIKEVGASPALAAPTAIEAPAEGDAAEGN